MIFTSLVLILILNLLLLYFKVFSLKTTLIINNVVFLLNIVFFYSSIYSRKKNYTMKQSSYSFSIVFPFILIIIYFLVRKFDILAKPFSDLFGYVFINNEINKLLNKTKIHETLFKITNPLENAFKNIGITSVFTIVYEIVATLIRIILFPIFIFSDPSTPYLETNDDDYYDNNWKPFVNSIPFESNGIDKMILTKNKQRVIQLKTVGALDKLYDDNIPFQYGGKEDSITEKIFKFLLDLPTTKNKDTIINLLNKTEKKVNTDKFVNLLDKKYMVSKIIWLIIIVILTSNTYKVLII